MFLLSHTNDTIVLLVCLCVPLLVLYDRLTRRIPSRLNKDEAPRSKFELVRADSFGPNTTAQGVEYVQAQRLLHDMC